MATKRGKSSRAKKGKTTTRQPTRKSQPATAKKAPVPTKPKRRSSASAPRVRASKPLTQTQPSLLERAEHLRDAIQRSKVTHPDPWSYTSKARGWGDRAQQLVEAAAAGRDGGALRGALDALTAEVEGDRDFQEARRLF